MRDDIPISSSNLKQDLKVVSSINQVEGILGGLHNAFLEEGDKKAASAVTECLSELQRKRQEAVKRSR